MTQLESATITWKINNFARLKSIKFSSSFETKQKKFYLICKPKDALQHLENSNCIQIGLGRADRVTADLKVLWTICVINDEGKECFRKDIETKFAVECEILISHLPIDGGSFNLARDVILDRSNRLLPGGNLTIKSTVTILDNQNSANDFKITLAHKKVLENYQSLLESGKLSDVVFVVGNKQFKLHKLILSAQSPVFSAMFENDMLETQQNRVNLIDVDVEVFEAMIRFIYSTNVDSVQQYALELFEAADKYQLDSLKDICADSLGSNLSIESVVNILLVADMHSDEHLKSKCIDYITQHSDRVIQTEAWVKSIEPRADLMAMLYRHISKSKFT